MKIKVEEIKLVRDLEMSELIEISEKLSRFMSDVSLKDGNKCANMKSVMSLLAINLKEGDDIIIEAKGEDCEEALEMIVNKIKQL